MNFLNDKGNSNHNIVVSTDGLRTVMKTPSVGEKREIDCLLCISVYNLFVLFIILSSF